MTNEKKVLKKEQKTLETLLKDNLDNEKSRINRKTKPIDSANINAGLSITNSKLPPKRG